MPIGNKNSELPENWNNMPFMDKRRWRQNNFINPKSVNFVSPAAEQLYQTRAQRIVDAYNLEEPDKVPLMLPVGNLPLHLYGINLHTAMNDMEEALKACDHFNQRYGAELEYHAFPMAMPARPFEILDYKLYAWPGYGLPEDAPAFQFVEGDYMAPEEYDDLIRDPSDFWLRTYLPRIFGGFESFRFLQPLTSIVEMPLAYLPILANPAVKESLRKMLAVSDEYEKINQIMQPARMAGPANGFPSFYGMFAGARAPFDTIGDTMRGTKGIMMDMLRQPDKLLAAIDVITEVTIHSLLTAARANPSHNVTFPLHKGADGWMSHKQFETFYWPSLKKIIDALVEDGMMVTLFAEGSYHSRLEYVNDFPKGSVNWWFDQTDMKRAKKILGDKCCIQGNVPSSLIVTGDPKEVKAYCRGLIEDCAAGGGFILGAGCNAENPKLENLQAMVAAINEYGVYRP